jgi:hypothetical protein
VIAALVIANGAPTLPPSGIEGLAELADAFALDGLDTLCEEAVMCHFES